MPKTLTIALAGNPNSGKTTLFNNITGARQHVGNYPGVTVEKKEGSTTHKGCRINVVDLPGTYSLTAYSIEELVARDFLLDERPDVVVDVVDASNLERNLYLAVQMIEMKVPLVLAFNMSDVAKARGITFDMKLLSRLLGTPIVVTVGNKAQGTEELLDTAAGLAEDRTRFVQPEVHYGREIEKQLARLSERIAANPGPAGKYDPRWLAIKLLENDGDIGKRLSAELLAAADQAARRLERLLGDSPETLIADHRYGFISGACQEAVRSSVEARHTMSDKIDAVMTSRILGLPVFFALMGGVFCLTFMLGEIPVGWLETFFAWLGGAVSAFWPDGADSNVRSLLVDGVIPGVGGVISFLPNILLLFLAIAMLEDTGYMARAAFVMDNLMHRIGLHGKSFIPMLIGFGCTVPAIMATRTIESRRDRLTTMLVLPLMSCGARLPIYILIVAAFFREGRGPVVWLMYMIGIVLAVGCAKLLRRTLFRGRTHPFVMELPPYRMPTLKSVLIHMWNRAWLYLKKAGTVILAISVVLWALGHWPKLDAERTGHFEARRAAVNAEADSSDPQRAAELDRIDNAEAAAALEHSVMGRIGHTIEPVLRPCGFDWKISTALIGAFAAKEVFVAQMGIVYAAGQSGGQSETLRQKLRARYTPLQGFCIMLFCLVSMPCVVTVIVTARESGSWKWALLQLSGLTALAYLLTVLVYQVGVLIP